MNKINGVFIVPTGIGCEIGGHAGDAVCSVNLIASICDNLIVNPNAVNASDINEMAPNCLYVEGSIIDQFLWGRVGLRKRRQNKILLVVNKLSGSTVNSVNAARVSLGLEIDIVELKTPLILNGSFDEGGAARGEVTGWEQLLDQVSILKFDALAIQTPIYVSDPDIKHYLEHGGVNPWGGVEAMASKLIAHHLMKPVAHAPKEREDSCFKDFRETVVDPRMSAEMVSVSYIHCVFKGLAKAPIPVRDGRPGDLTFQDFDFLVTPDGCFGEPHRACLDQGIEVIVVRENRSVLKNGFPKDCTFVENYLECAGWVACRSIGIDPKQTVRR